MRSLVSSNCLRILSLNGENELFRCSDYGCMKIMVMKLNHKDYYNLSIIRTRSMPLETKFILFLFHFIFLIYEQMLFLSVVFFIRRLYSFLPKRADLPIIMLHKVLQI